MNYNQTILILSTNDFNHLLSLRITLGRFILASLTFSEFHKKKQISIYFIKHCILYEFVRVRAKFVRIRPSSCKICANSYEFMEKIFSNR